MTLHEGDSVRAVDPATRSGADSRSTPDDALTSPAVSPEAAPPRATTPEPMTEDRYIELGAMHRAGWRGSHAFHYGRRVLSDLYNEVTRLRALAGTPSLESGLAASWKKKAKEYRRLYDLYFNKHATSSHVADSATAAERAERRLLYAKDEQIATLERDAARMREAGESGELVAAYRDAILLVECDLADDDRDADQFDRAVERRTAAEFALSHRLSELELERDEFKERALWYHDALGRSNLARQAERSSMREAMLDTLQRLDAVAKVMPTVNANSAAITLLFDAKYRLRAALSPSGESTTTPET